MRVSLRKIAFVAAGAFMIMSAVPMISYADEPAVVNGSNIEDESSSIPEGYTGFYDTSSGISYCTNGAVDTSVNGLVKGTYHEKNKWAYVVNGVVTGLNALAPNSWGWWYVGSDGFLDYSYNGIASNEWGTWCVTNGKVNQSVNGITEFSGTKYYFVDGKLTGANSLIADDEGTWYVNSEGIADSSFTGFFTNDEGTWYIANGKVDTSASGLTTAAGTTCYLADGKADANINGLTKMGSTWYYFKDGVVTGLNALAKNNWGWWYIDETGRIDQSFDGVAANEWGTWRVINGKVTTSANGFVEASGVWYYFVNGKVSSVNLLQHNDSGWWYIGENGTIDSSYTGLASDGENTWCVRNGKADESANGLVSLGDTLYYFNNGKLAVGMNGLTKVGNTWYYFKNGVVTGLNALAKNAWGWWYVNSDGVIDQTFNGTASNEWGTWCVIDGKLKTSVNGIFEIDDIKYYFVNGKLTGLNDIADDGENRWYVNEDGVVNETFTGLFENSDGTWYINSGRVSSETNGLASVSLGSGIKLNGTAYSAGSTVTAFFVDGRIDETVKGLTKVGNTWYYFKNGVVTGLNALAKNAWGWWYVGSNGQIDTAYTGLANNDYGTWYVVKGKLNRSINGMNKLGNTWYYFVNGKVTGLNGLAYNNWGWWYIGSDGKIDTTYYGTSTNEWGTWYVAGGKLTDGYTGLVTSGKFTYLYVSGANTYNLTGLYNINGTWYYFVRNCVTAGPMLQKKSDGWWYVGENGTIDYSYNGTMFNRYGTWNVVNGKVTTKYEGQQAESVAFYNVSTGAGSRAACVSIRDLALSQVGQLHGEPYIDYYGFNYHVAWCACFVEWVMRHDPTGNVTYPTRDLTGSNAYCQSIANYLKKAGKWGDRYYTGAVAGDVIFFDWEQDGHTDHIGVVVGRDSKYVYTVEGNAGRDGDVDAVRIRKYELGSPDIYGYGLFDY